ncbi:DUF5677 domain-containing protein [Microcoleus sp. AT9b-C3]|uniref:DUF5677 domain-containing protein n=1 Tax=unclassified Microcoleus TaxID=2642155 RepID=UPI002FD00DBA
MSKGFGNQDRKKLQNNPGHTPLKQHQKKGTALKSQLANLPISETNWERDWLPEYLWIASLRDVVPTDKLYEPYYAFMEAIGEFLEGEQLIIGLVSDFAALAPHRDRLLAKHGELIEQLFLRPFGRILACYPNSPASWLVNQEFIERGGHLDREVEIPRIRSLVTDLVDGRGELATAARMASFGQVVKSGKVRFPRGLPIVDLLPKYPNQCSHDECKQVEGFVRASLGSILSTESKYESKEWSKYFWRHNYDLATCQPVLLGIRGAKPASENDINQAVSVIETNVKAARAYLENLAMQLQYDLYAPERQEVLSGLFARCIRLFLLIMENPALWARDTAGIMLRCLVETTITFCYLAEHGTEDEFESFRQYGEAQKKLLMLQLQDNHPDSMTLEGRDASDISKELGGFSAEILQIELGHWAKKDARQLAYTAGLERYYRLVFTPTSADIHGTWTSLKDSNLGVCAEPLHRFHQIPTYAEPPLYLYTLQAAHDLLEKAYEAGVRALGFPPTLELLSLLPNDTDDVGVTEQI